MRARLAVLTEVPECFRSTIQRWHQRNEPLRKDGVPSANTEYLYYQTLIGAWPIELERASAYMLKAVREAKQETSWTDINSEYEDALHQFVQHTLEDADGFVTEVERFVAHIQKRGPHELAGADLAEIYRSRHSRSLSRRRSCGTIAWSIPTTARRCALICASACWMSWTR